MKTIADLEREFYLQELGLEESTLTNADLKKQWLELQLTESPE